MCYFRLCWIQECLKCWFCQRPRERESLNCFLRCYFRCREVTNCAHESSYQHISSPHSYQYVFGTTAFTLYLYKLHFEMCLRRSVTRHMCCESPSQTQMKPKFSGWTWVQTRLVIVIRCFLDPETLSTLSRTGIGNGQETVNYVSLETKVSLKLWDHVSKDQCRRVSVTMFIIFLMIIGRFNFISPWKKYWAYVGGQQFKLLL